MGNFIEAQHHHEQRGCCSLSHLFFLNRLNVHGLSGFGLVFSLLSDKRNKACKVIFTLIYRSLCPSKTSKSAPGKKEIESSLCLMGQSKMWTPTAVKKT